MILSFDIGGTKISYGLVKDNKVFSYKKILWDKPLTKEKIINKITQIINSFLTTHKPITHVSVGFAGQVNFKEGSVILSPNISEKREKIPLKNILEKRFHRPVFIDNDANLFTLGEAVFGQGKSSSVEDSPASPAGGLKRRKDNFVVGLTIGTGIGGGIVIDKKIIRGRDGFAGEFGHLILEVGGRKCSCGKRGCFEAYASGRAMEELYFELTGKKKNTFQIKKEFLEKKPDALLVVNETAQWLAVGLANLINILNPDVVVLGGGIVGFKSFIKIAFKNIKPWLLTPEAKTKIFVSDLKEKAGLLGAALLTYNF